MKRFLLLLYPKEFRRRHGDELADHLESTDTSIRDGMDIVRSALSMRLKLIIQAKTVLIRIAVVLATASVLLLGRSLGDLTNGLADVPRHWWSALPIVGLVVAGGLGLVAAAGSRSSDDG